MSTLIKITHIPEINNIIQDYLWGNKITWKEKHNKCILPTFNKPKDTILLHMIPTNNKIKYICMDYEWVDRLPYLIENEYPLEPPVTTIDDIIEESEDDNIYEILSYLFFFFSM